MRRYFALEVPQHNSNQVWCVDGLEAYRVGVPDPQTYRNTLFTLSDIADLQVQFEHRFPVWKGLRLFELELAPGEYFGRMARPIQSHPQDFARLPRAGLYTQETTQAVGQLMSLESRLREICQVVEPLPQNFDVFGHSIRECLILAAMEVESHCKAVLRENNYTGPNTSTKDYVKLKTAMKLDQYKVGFVRYPQVAPLAPFERWEAKNPTRSLPFYDAYNAVKHNREDEFDRGTLEHALSAVSACVILSVAQFGFMSVIQKSRALFEFFSLVEVPSWSPAECYAVARDETPTKSRDFLF